MTQEKNKMYESDFMKLSGLPLKEYKHSLLKLIDEYQRSRSMSSPDNRQLLRRMYDALYNKSTLTEKFWIRKFLNSLDKLERIKR